MRSKYLHITLFYILLSANLFPQDTIPVNKKKLAYTISAETGLYGISMVGLYSLWYKDYPHSSFHWFDDSKEWLQMDKTGHFYSAYYLNKITTESFKWCDLNHKKSTLYGSAASFIYIATIEVFDGFSEKWGASYSDLIANTGGIGLHTVQKLTWREQRIIPKFSFHNSHLWQCRPDALGETFMERLLKDYNGQTYWLSFNLNSLTTIKKIPKWLNLSVGYSGENMLGGMDNDISLCNFEVSPERYRQFYLSFDVDFTKINTNKKYLKIIFEAVNTLKVPFPSLVYSKYGFEFDLLYF